MANNEEKQKIKKVVMLACIIILAFLTALLAIKLEVPSFDKLEEKMYTFEDLYMAYNTLFDNTSSLYSY